MNRFDDNVVMLPGAEELRTEAAAWITVLGREHVSGEDLIAFRAWLAKSDQHQTAFESLSTVCADLPILRELDDIAEATLANFPAETFVGRRRAVMAAAASLAAFVVAGGVYFARKASNQTQNVELATDVGEQQTYELSDGSAILLNTDSRAEVEFTPSKRVVRLTRGEAHFKVAKDADRPFSVYAADGIVTAVGTAFAVRLREHNAVEVTVEEGRVALASNRESAINNNSSPEGASDEAGGRANGHRELAQLSAGQSTVFEDRVENIEQMAAPAIKRKLAWRQGFLAYSGEPLSEVIADVSRYTNVKIEVSDPDLLQRRVAGYFQIGNVEASIDSLASSFDLSVEHIGIDHIRLSDAL
ncbi:MAG: FecR domain-containing protein [Amphiplicatus sp.]